MEWAGLVVSRPAGLFDDGKQYHAMPVLFRVPMNVTGGLSCHITYVTIFVPRTTFFIT
jgi:hypothetical protein